MKTTRIKPARRVVSASLLRHLLAATLAAMFAFSALPAAAQTATVPSTPVLTPSSDSGKVNVFTVLATWRNPSGTTNTRLRAREKGDVEWQDVVTVGSARTTHHIGPGNHIFSREHTGREGLKHGATYEVQVAAFKGSWGAWSATGEGRAGMPSDVLDARLASLEVVDSEGAAVFLTPDFDPDVFAYQAYFGAPATATTVTVTVMREGSAAICASRPCSESSAVTPDAQGGVRLALTADGSSEAIIRVTPLIVFGSNRQIYTLQLNHLPAPPQELQVRATTDRPEPLIHVTWTRPVSAHASAYYIHIKDADTADWPRADGEDHSLPAGLTFAAAPAQIEQSEQWSAAIEGFTADALYDVRVAGADGARIGPFSQTLQTRVAFTVPRTAPRNVTAHPSANALQMEWEAPQDSGIAAAFYKVRWARVPAMGAAPEYLNEDRADGIVTTATARAILGLVDGLEYQVEVAGATTFGIGVWSAPVTGIPSALRLDAPPDVRAYAESALPAGRAFPAAKGGTEPYVYSVTGLPPGLSFDADTRILSGTPDAVTALATYTPAYRVTDSTMPVISRSSAFTIQLAAPLTLTDRGLSFQADEDVTGTLSAAIGGFPALTYSLTGALPAGLSFDAESRTIGGIPRMAGAFPVVYAVQDALGSRAEVDLTFTVTVVAPGAPQVTVEPTGAASELRASWAAPIARGGVAASALTYTLRWADEDTPAAFLNAGEEDGVASDSASAHAITGLPAGKAYLVQIMAGNTFGASDWSEAVRAAPSALTFGEQPDLRIYGNGMFTLAATGGDLQLAQAEGGTPPYVYSHSVTEKPASAPALSLSFDRETAVLSGVPAAVSAITTYQYTYVVTDSAAPVLRAQQTVTILVAPVFEVDEETPSFAADSNVDFVLQEGRGGFPPYEYTATLDSEIPPGMMFSADSRRLQGIPRENSGPGVTYLLKRTVRDSTGLLYLARTFDAEIRVRITPVAPAAPGNVAAATRDGNSGLQVRWDAPIATGGYGAAALTYELRWKGIADATYAAADAANTAPGMTTHIIAPLLPGESYDVQVRSLNDTGMSDWTVQTRGIGGISYVLNDLDATGDAEVTWQEGVLVVRYLLGLRGAALTNGLGYGSAAAEVAAAAAESLALGVDTGKLDVNGDGKTTAADGILIARHALGVNAGDALTSGQAAAGMTDAVLEKLAALITQETPQTPQPPAPTDPPVAGDPLHTLKCLKKPDTMPDCP